jgi:methylated-DNA-[protein]-cysteine S-methyltransferase
MAQRSLSSPIGPILLHTEGGVLISVHIGEGPGGGGDPLLDEAAAQLDAWFAGRLRRFDLPLAAPGTPRGSAHRDAIEAIPYGDTASYGAIARAIGSSPRAVGQACRRNPFPILIPCHRVIGSGGAIGHYSGGAGVSTKLWLLQHEQGHGLKG